MFRDYNHKNADTNMVVKLSLYYYYRCECVIGNRPEDLQKCFPAANR
jgi:hypothetical protein